jgi:hypothetical protein
VRSSARRRRSIKRAALAGDKSNQQDLMNEMEPQRRPCVELVEVFESERRNHMHIVRRRNGRRKFDRRFELILIELCFLGRKKTAYSLTMGATVARLRPWLTVIISGAIVAVMMVAANAGRRRGL